MGRTMTGEGSTESGAHVSSAGVRCEEYPEGCQFAMQAGVFDTETNLEGLLPSVERDACPSCGGRLTQWDPQFASVAPGRPAEW